MKLARVWAPLVGRGTVRRGVHLLLGGVILIPYVLLAVTFVQLLNDPVVPTGVVVVLAVITVVIGSVPPFLPAMRTLEIVASRGLLDVDLPDPSDDPPWESRLLAAGWYVVHLLAGGVVLLSVLLAAPLAVVYAVAGLGGQGNFDDLGPVPFGDLTGGWALLVVVALVVLPAYLVAGLGALLASIAPLLLGPSAVELQTALERQAERFAERNRLARELHDSVGHALTITTLQAAAARRVLDTDPAFARRALRAVEETGRAAMEDLDHVLGLLRADTADAANAESVNEPTVRPAPQRTLADVAHLVDDTRAAGVHVDARIDGDLATVPPAVSREAYRIVQEGLTNAVRHAGPVPVTLRVTATLSGLDVDLSNPVHGAGPSSSRTGGRGLRGMRERVRVLQGQLTAGPDDGYWRVHVHLPAHRPTGPTNDGGAP